MASCMRIKGRATCLTRRPRLFSWVKFSTCTLRREMAKRPLDEGPESDLTVSDTTKESCKAKVHGIYYSYFLWRHRVQTRSFGIFFISVSVSPGSFVVLLARSEARCSCPAHAAWHRSMRKCRGAYSMASEHAQI